MEGEIKDLVLSHGRGVCRYPPHTHTLSIFQIALSHTLTMQDVRVVVHKINVLQVPLSIVIKFLQNKPQ